MKKENWKNKGCARAHYVSPGAKVVEIAVQGVLCQSGGIDGFNKRDDDSSNW